MDRLNVQLRFKGFTDRNGFRVLRYEDVPVDHAKPPFFVSADTAMSQRYGISLQALPLLCRTALERSRGLDDSRNLTYTEADMCRDADTAPRQRVLDTKRPSRKPAILPVSVAWQISSPMHPGEKAL